MGMVQAGMMGTHGEETRKFFKHSSVTCVLAPRHASSKLSFSKQQAGSSSDIFVIAFSYD
jgi:phospholipase D1/2